MEAGLLTLGYYLETNRFFPHQPQILCSNAPVFGYYTGQPFPGQDEFPILNGVLASRERETYIFRDE